MFTKFLTKLTLFEKCNKCGALYDSTTTCVPCAVVYATITLTIQEVSRMHNCAWLGKEYKCEHLAS
jgi:hypothetical protein